MTQRLIGQEGSAFARGRRSSLDEFDSLINWHPVVAVPSEIHAAAKGEPAWPPLALFKVRRLGLVVQVH